jgi:hypothetical protein
VPEQVKALFRTARHVLVAASHLEMAAEATGVPLEHIAFLFLGHVLLSSLDNAWVYRLGELLISPRRYTMGDDDGE